MDPIDASELTAAQMIELAKAESSKKPGDSHYMSGISFSAPRAKVEYLVTALREIGGAGAVSRNPSSCAGPKGYIFDNDLDAFFDVVCFEDATDFEADRIDAQNNAD